MTNYKLKYLNDDADNYLGDDTYITHDKVYEAWRVARSRATFETLVIIVKVDEEGQEIEE